MTQPQGPQPDPQSNQQPNMGPNPNPQQPWNGTPPPQIMYVEKPKRPWYQRPGCLIPLILVILLIFGLVSCTALMGKTVSEVDKSLNEEKTVVYRVGGDAQDIRVMYTAGGGQSASDSGVTSGWEKEVKVKGIFGAYEPFPARFLSTAKSSRKTAHPGSSPAHRATPTSPTSPRSSIIMPPNPSETP